MSTTTAPTVPHPFADLIGLEITGRGEGHCTSELTIKPDHYNPNQVVHGAVIYALADTGMGGALMSVLDDSRYCSTIEIKINYFKPAVSGKLRCETRVVNLGSRTAALESEIFDERAKLLARATGTFMILERPTDIDPKQGSGS